MTQHEPTEPVEVIQEDRDMAGELYRLGLWGPHGGDTLLAAAVRSELQKGMSDG